MKAQALGEQAGALLTSDLAARAYLAAARAAHLRSAADDAQRLCELVLAQHPSERIQVETLWTEFNSTREGDPAEAATILEQLQAITLPDPSHSLRLRSGKGVVLCDAGRIPEAINVLEVAVASLSQNQDPFARTSTLHYLAYAYLLAARYDDSVQASQRQITEGRETGLEFAVDHGLLRLIGANVGFRKFADANRAIHELRNRITKVSGFIRENLALQEVKLAIAVGDLERGRTLLERDFGDDTRPAFFGEVAAYKGLVRAALGDIDAAEQLFAEDERNFRFVESRSLRDVVRAVIDLQRDPDSTSAATIIARLMSDGTEDAVVTGVRAFPSLAVASAKTAPTRSVLTDLLARSRDADIARKSGISVVCERWTLQLMS